LVHWTNSLDLQPPLVSPINLKLALHHVRMLFVCRCWGALAQPAWWGLSDLSARIPSHSVHTLLQHEMQRSPVAMAQANNDIAPLLAAHHHRYCAQKDCHWAVEYLSTLCHALLPLHGSAGKTNRDASNHEGCASRVRSSMSQQLQRASQWQISKERL
jgi:hypothetical protein